MPKRLSKKSKSEDVAQSAFRAMQRVIDITEAPAKPLMTNVVPMRRRKNSAAVELGRKGGRNSAKGRMEKIAPEDRRRIASDAARARWAKKKSDG